MAMALTGTKLCAQPCPVSEMPSGPTFRVSNDGPGVFNFYSWLALDPAWPYNKVGLSITTTEPATTLCGTRSASCSDHYSSGDGGVSFPCSGTVPNLPGTLTDAILDPTCSFDSRPPFPNEVYGAWLRKHGWCQAPLCTESDVVANRLVPPWCPAPSCGTWDPTGPRLVFDPPPSNQLAFDNEPYGVNQPFLVVDQRSTVPNQSPGYLVAIYWVPPDDPLYRPYRDLRNAGTHVFCRTLTAAGAAWTVNPPAPVHPAPSQIVTSSPGGVPVSNPNYQDLIFEGPYLAIAPDGKVYCAWLWHGPGGAYIMMNRSVDGGATWGVEGGTYWGDCTVVGPFPALQFFRVTSVRPPSPSDIWANSHPRIAVDPSNSDLVHLIYVQGSGGGGGGGQGDIRYMALQWPAVRTQQQSCPATVASMQVNDPASSAANQFHPTMAVDSSGAVHVFWYDNRREDPSDERHDIYGSTLRPGWTQFGGRWYARDRRFSLCPTWVSSFVPRTYRYLYPPQWFPHLGNYIGGPQALGMWYSDEPWPTHLLDAFWLYAPMYMQGQMESDVFITPTRPDSLIPSAEQVNGGSPITFYLSAGALNANRPYVLVASIYGTDPGFDLIVGSSPVCPESLPTPAFRESVFPLRLDLTYILIGTGSLNAAGYITHVYNVPPHTGTTVYDVAYFLPPPGPTGLGGYDFVSNPVQIRVDP